MNAETRFVLTQSVDVALSIGRPGLMEARLAAVGSSATVVREAAGRFDVVMQRLAAAGNVPDVDVPLGLERWFASQFETALAGPHIALAVLSVRDELVADVWRHRDHGFVVQPPSNIAEEWTDEQRQWLNQNFDLVKRPTAQESADLLAKINEIIDDEAVLAVFNVSTCEHVGVRHDLTEEVFPIQAHRIDLALEKTAARDGFAVIDVDHSVAEYGGVKAVVAPATYTATASEAIAEDALGAINALGVQGLSLGSDVMRLDVPAYDRRTTRGRIDTWHIAPGSVVERGSPLFDVTFENLMHRLDYEAQETNRTMSITVVAAEDGLVATVDAADGTEVTVGQTVGVMVRNESVSPRRIDDVDDGIPPFRVGVQVK